MPVSIPPILLVCIGACFGAAARWQLGIVLNRYGQVATLGTLAANWLGCFLAGAVLGLSPNQMCRLLLVTGFLGSFTTFSAFSAEVAEKLLAARYAEAAVVLLLHMAGGIALTLLGFALARQV